MIADETRLAILGMHEKGMKIRQIARSLGVSRNTVRTVLKGSTPQVRDSSPSFQDELPLIREAFAQCRGNVIRVAEVLAEKGIVIGYSTLTRIARDQGRSQIRTGAGPRVMASLRNLAISILRRCGATNIAKTLRWFAFNTHLALRLIGL